MANFDNYINNLKNILNGECPENNPLKYFTQPKCFFDTKDLKSIKTMSKANHYSMDLWVKENYNDTNLIYTFVKDLENKKITIISINKETEEIEKTYIVNDYTPELDEFNYYLYIVKNNLYYTYIDINKWTWLGCIDLTEDHGDNNVIELDNSEKVKPEDNTDLLLCPKKLNLEFFSDKKYLYIKVYYVFKKCILRYNIQTKDVDKFLVDDNLSNNFTFTVCDNIIYVVDGDGVLKKHRINEDNTTTLISETELDNSDDKKKLVIVDGILYVSNVTINNKNNLVAYEKNSLKKIWNYETTCIIVDFKIIYSDIFFEEGTLLKKVNKDDGCLLFSTRLQYLRSFEVSRDSNVYLLFDSKVSMLIPRL